MIRAGFYEDTLESEEILGLVCQWFPNVNRDSELEEIVASVCFN